MRPRKRTLYQKLRSWYFTLPICKLFPCRGKLLSRILVQFPPEFSTTMFVLIKNLDYRKNKGFIAAIWDEQIVLFYHALLFIFWNTRPAQLASCLFSCCLLFFYCPSFNWYVPLNCTQTVPKHKEVPSMTEKIEFICISDRRVSIGAIP